MRYASARCNQYRRDAVYRIYVTECLRILAKYYGQGDISHYNDLITPAKSDNRTGDEIAADVISRAGLEVVD